VTFAVGTGWIYRVRAHRGRLERPDHPGSGRRRSDFAPDDPCDPGRALIPGL